jgi:hypothetical protein
VSAPAPKVVTLTPEEIEAKLYTLRSDREEWDRLADTYRNYWRLADEISHYEWLLGDTTADPQ